MTRKDYAALAAGLREGVEATKACHSKDAQDAYEMAVYDVARVLAADNPRFDRARFLKACGVTA